MNVYIWLSARVLMNHMVMYICLCASVCVYLPFCPCVNESYGCIFAYAPVYVYIWLSACVLMNHMVVYLPMRQCMCIFGFLPVC